MYDLKYDLNLTLPRHVHLENPPFTTPEFTLKTFPISKLYFMGKVALFYILNFNERKPIFCHFSISCMVEPSIRNTVN